MKIASFDIGSRNFAFVVEEFDDNMLKCKDDVYENGKILTYVNIDLTRGGKDTFKNMILELDKHSFDGVNVALIEEQMNRNIKALKISQACITYWKIKYPECETIEYKSYYKTQILDAPKKMTKPQRKKWSVEEATTILVLREDYENLTYLSCTSKRDDLADVITQLQSFKILRYVYRKI
jgi:hypothetical protein